MDSDGFLEQHLSSSRSSERGHTSAILLQIDHDHVKNNDCMHKCRQTHLVSQIPWTPTLKTLTVSILLS